MPVSFLNAEDRGMICYKMQEKERKGLTDHGKYISLLKDKL